MSTALLIAATTAEYATQYFLAAKLQPNGRIVALKQWVGTVPSVRW
jgi:hypothetical protein